MVLNVIEMFVLIQNMLLLRTRNCISCIRGVSERCSLCVCKCDVLPVQIVTKVCSCFRRVTSSWIVPWI